MGMINWGAGLSAAGGGMAAVGMEGLKSVLEQQKIQLASDLAGAREKELAGINNEAADRRLDKTEGGADRRQTAQIASSEKIHTASEAGQDRRSAAQIASHEKISQASLESSERIHGAANAIARGQLDLATARDNIDNDLKQITLGNAQEVQKLQKEYKAAKTPAEQDKIRETIQLLTGKDNDNLVPLPEKDALGNTTYSKALNKKTGQIVSLTDATSKGPPVGTEVGGKVFQGGDPNSPESWKPKGSKAAKTEAREGYGAKVTEIPRGAPTPNDELAAQRRARRIADEDNAGAEEAADAKAATDRRLARVAAENTRRGLINN